MVVCPSCGRRAGRLHHLGGFSAFACRRCHDLGYESARLSRSFTRALFKRAARVAGTSYAEARDDFRRRHGGYVHETKYLRVGVGRLS